MPGELAANGSLSRVLLFGRLCLRDGGGFWSEFLTLLGEDELALLDNLDVVDDETGETGGGGACLDGT